MRQVCVYTACGCTCVHVFWVALLGATPQTLYGWKEGHLELGNSLRLQSPESMPGLGSLDWVGSPEYSLLCQQDLRDLARPHPRLYLAGWC